MSKKNKILTEVNSYSFGLLLGAIFGISITFSFFMFVNDYPIYSNIHALKEEINGSITGTYFPESTYCIMMNRNNQDVLNTLSHEHVHHLIVQNMTCGDISCYEHFCQ